MADARIESRPDEQVRFLDLLIVLAANVRLLIAFPLIAGAIAIAVLHFWPPTYVATTRIVPPGQSTAATLSAQVGALASLAGLAGTAVKSPTEMYVSLLKSRTVADRLIDRFSLLNAWETGVRDDARRRLAAATDIHSGKDGLIKIEVEAEDAKAAAELANAYVEELSRLVAALALTEAQQRRVFFEKQLVQSQQELKKAQAALAASGAGEGLIKSAPQAVVENIARLKAQVTAQEIRLATMSSFLTESSPTYQLALNELRSLQTQLRLAEKNQTSGSGPKFGDEYLNRFRDFKYQEALFELIAKQYELARLEEAKEGASIQVVDVALPPERPAKPRKTIITFLVMLASLFSAFIYALLRDSLDRLKADPRESEKLTRLRSLVALRRM